MNSLRKNLTAVVAMVGLMGWSGTASAQDAMRVAQLALPAVVMMVVFDQNQEPFGRGTGFVIGEELVATNAHMVTGIHFAAVGVVASEDFFAVEAVLALDIEHDLAIISVPGISGDHLLGLGNADLVQVGQPIVAVGNPRGLKGTVSDGIISAIRNSDGNKIFQITAPISPGSSGGPILNMKGEVIGVASFIGHDGANLGFAAPVSYLQDLLAVPFQPVSHASLANVDMGEGPGRGAIRAREESVALDGAFLSDCAGGQSTASVAFSIRNQTPEQMGRVEVLVILYGQDGKPAESFQTTHLPGLSDLLNPGAEAQVTQRLSCDAVRVDGWSGGAGFRGIPGARLRLGRRHRNRPYRRSAALGNS